MLAVTKLLYDSEAWIRKATNISIIQETEIIFLSVADGCTKKHLNNN